MLLFFCLELRLLFVNSFNLSLYYVLLTLLSFIESQRFTHKQNMSFLLTYGSLQTVEKEFLVLKICWWACTLDSSNDLRPRHSIISLIGSQSAKMHATTLSVVKNC